MVDCITFYPGTEKWFPYVMLTIFAFAILHEIYFAIFSIFNFYLSHNIPQVLKRGSIMVTVLIGLSQIVLVVIWISDYECNSFLYFMFAPAFTVLYGSCYVLLFTMFAIKVHASTRDSIYRLSKCFIAYLTTLSLTFIFVVIILIFFYASKNTAFEYINLSILLAMIINWTLYISLLFKLIKALFYVLKTSLILSASYDQSKHPHASSYTYDQGSNNVATSIKTSTNHNNSSNANNSSYNDGIDNINNINNSRVLLFDALFTKFNVSNIKQTIVTDRTDHNSVIGKQNCNQTLDLSVRNRGAMDLNRSMIKALGIGKMIVRLVIVISVVFISGIMVTITTFLPYIETQDKSSAGLRLNLMYLCYLIDLKINNVCLLYQYGFAQKMFDNNCQLCVICFKHIVFRSLKAKLIPNQTGQS